MCTHIFVLEFWSTFYIKERKERELKVLRVGELKKSSSISEEANKTNLPPPRLVANKSFQFPVSAHTQFLKISDTNWISFFESNSYRERTWSLLFWKIQFSLEKYLSKGSIEPVAAGFIGFWPHYKIFPTIVKTK